MVAELLPYAYSVSTVEGYKVSESWVPTTQHQGPLTNDEYSMQYSVHSIAVPQLPV